MVDSSNTDAKGELSKKAQSIIVVISAAATVIAAIATSVAAYFAKVAADESSQTINAVRTPILGLTCTFADSRIRYSTYSTDPATSDMRSPGRDAPAYEANFDKPGVKQFIECHLHNYGQVALQQVVVRIKQVPNVDKGLPAQEPLRDLSTDPTSIGASGEVNFSVGNYTGFVYTGQVDATTTAIIPPDSRPVPVTMTLNGIATRSMILSPASPSP
jgi:hypothetical protein